MEEKMPEQKQSPGSHLKGVSQGKQCGQLCQGCREAKNWPLHLAPQIEIISDLKMWGWKSSQLAWIQESMAENTDYTLEDSRREGKWVRSSRAGAWTKFCFLFSRMRVVFVCLYPSGITQWRGIGWWTCYMLFSLSLKMLKEVGMIPIL